jgi:holin-like protein
MPFLLGMTLILIYQLLGEILVVVFELLIPGPVLGMLLLFATLVAWGGLPASLDHAAGALLGHLSLFFVPAGVGVILHLHRLGHEWLPIALALVISTVATLAATAATMLAVQYLLGGKTPP